MTPKKKAIHDNILQLLDNEELKEGMTTDEHWAMLLGCTEALKAQQDAAPDTDEAWNSFAATRLPKKQHRLWPRVATLMAAAAAVAVLVVMALPWLQRDETLYTAMPQKAQVEVRAAAFDEVEVIGRHRVKAAQSTSVGYKTIKVPERQDYQLTLADGTKVWLNAGTRLTYPEQFTERERVVALSGEAYFEVQSDAAHPFVVEAGNLRTYVTGTKFNVRTYVGEEPKVTLVEGVVTVEGGGQRVQVAPGEHAVLEETRLYKETADLEASLAWHEGMLFFMDASLRDILLAMGQWYNLTVVCRDKAETMGHSHFACDRKGKVEDAVALLRELTGENIYIKGNTIYIQK